MDGFQLRSDRNENCALRHWILGLWFTCSRAVWFFSGAFLYFPFYAAFLFRNSAIRLRFISHRQHQSSSFAQHTLHMAIFRICLIAFLDDFIFESSLGRIDPRLVLTKHSFNVHWGFLLFFHFLACGLVWFIAFIHHYYPKRKNKFPFLLHDIAIEHFGFCNGGVERRCNSSHWWLALITFLSSHQFRGCSRGDLIAE